MKITELLVKETMNLDLKAKKKDQVLDELIDSLVKTGRVTHAKNFKKAILAREKLGTTGIGDNIAIPHAKSSYVTQPTLAFGISRGGVNYGSMDGQPAKIFFMIAVPENGGNLHLEALSTLARMLIYEEFRDGLYGAKTKEDVLDLINNEQQKKEETL